MNRPMNAEVVTEILLEIIQAAYQAYEQHTGEAVDPKLIQAELPFYPPSTH